MSIFNKYPYTDFHELNLDWVIAQVKALDAEMDDFIAANKLTWAGNWTASKAYTKWSIVQDANGDAYVAIQPVPVNVQLSDQTYWEQVSAYSSLYAAFNSRISAIEGSYVPKTRTVNSKALSANITLNSDDIPYDNTQSGLAATNVEAAVDELAANGTLSHTTVTQHGITLDIYKRYGVVTLTTSGTLDTSLTGGAVIVTVPSGYRPPISIIGWDAAYGRRMNISTSGEFTASSAVTSGEIIRATFTYLGG